MTTGRKTSKQKTVEEKSSSKKSVEARGPGERSTGREYLDALLIAGVFLLFANAFVVKTFYIPSSSMEETLLIGDHLFVNRFLYGPPTQAIDALLPHRPIERGDIVIFRSPREPKQDMVKRCIGLPGDKIEMRDKDLYINDQWVQDASFTVHREPSIIPQRDNFRPIVVREDEFFCLGDNRDVSFDSRFWGGVPREYVKGRAVLIYWSFGGETPDGQWRGFAYKLGQLAKTLVTFPTKTRWERTFKVIR